MCPLESAAPRVSGISGTSRVPVRRRPIVKRQRYLTEERAAKINRRRQCAGRLGTWARPNALRVGGKRRFRTHTPKSSENGAITVPRRGLPHSRQRRIVCVYPCTRIRVYRNGTDRCVRERCEKKSQSTKRIIYIVVRGGIVTAGRRRRRRRRTTTRRRRRRRRRREKKSLAFVSSYTAGIYTCTPRARTAYTQTRTL